MCKQCGSELPQGKRSYCSTKCSDEAKRDAYLVKTYGITLLQYQDMFEEQDGKCAICLRRSLKKNLAVDHNHKTGKIRGLLCGRCNHKLLGAAFESADILRRAAAYLDKYTL